MTHYVFSRLTMIMVVLKLQIILLAIIYICLNVIVITLK